MKDEVDMHVAADQLGQGTPKTADIRPRPKVIGPKVSPKKPEGNPRRRRSAMPREQTHGWITDVDRLEHLFAELPPLVMRNTMVRLQAIFDATMGRLLGE